MTIRQVLHDMVSHPLALNSMRHWLRLQRALGPVDARHRNLARKITLVSPLTAPLRFAERIMYGRALSRFKLREDPVFILGHWRTGTTHLHNLLALDPNFRHVSTFQTLAPSSFLLGDKTLKPLIAYIMPRKRHTDNMPLSADTPQEEEFAMCNLCPYSVYAGWYFPRRLPELFRKYVLFDDVSAETVAEWKRVYLDLLKKAARHGGGRRLVLKNPANTGRVPLLLEMFPNAKFIHIHRDPYVVFKSTQLLHRATIDLIGLQDISDEEIRGNVLLFFKEMMQRYFEDRARIPAGNLAEIRYEDLEQRPVEQLGRLYEELRLPGFDETRRRAAEYVRSLETYKKNRFSISAEDIAHVQGQWGFALDAWNYEAPRPE